MTYIIRCLAFAITVVGSLAIAQQKPDELTLQLKWVTQAQFAGYYVALDKGFYRDENLAVTVKAGGPDKAPPWVMASGDADIMVDWMPSALATREKGLTVVNIAQPFKRSGLMLACRKESGIKEAKDLKGKVVGVWYYGNEYPFYSWMDKLVLSSGGLDSGADVRILKQGFTVKPLFQRTADCVSAMSYNEYFHVLDGGLSASDLRLFKYEDEGVATLEDGLYTLQKNLDDDAFVDKAARFVRASMKGWQYAQFHPDDAAAIVMKYDAPGLLDEEHQRRMMREVNKLTYGSTGRLDLDDYQRTVDSLLSGGANPVIGGPPVGAWTHDVIDRALK